MAKTLNITPLVKITVGIVLAALLLSSCAQEQNKDQQDLSEAPTMTLQLTSTAFSNNEKIPSKYTCDGSDTSPPLSINGVPAVAKSLVLLMDDPDIPEFVKQKFGITVWDHWVVFNIPPTTTSIAEGKNPPGVLGRNTGGKNAYGGPCPPDREHRYFFKLYALDTMLDLPVGAAKAEVEQAMKGHILAEARLVGLYQRNK